MRSDAPSGAPSGSGSETTSGATPPPDDPFAADLREFGPVGIVAIVVVFLGNFLFAPLSAILALTWARQSHTPWRELGFVRPRSWTLTVLGGILFGVALKFVMKAVVMPLLGAPPINQAYHFLAGNPAAVPGYLFAFIVGAGFGEETFFRGYLFERARRLLGPGVGARVATVLVTSIYFGLLHYRVQGLPGAEQAIITGLTFGTIFAFTRRVWFLIFAHAAFDLTAYAMIYWSLETRVAHLLFR